MRSPMWLHVALSIASGFWTCAAINQHRSGAGSWHEAAREKSNVNLTRYKELALVWGKKRAGRSRAALSAYQRTLSPRRLFRRGRENVSDDALQHWDVARKGTLLAEAMRKPIFPRALLYDVVVRDDIPNANAGGKTEKKLSLSALRSGSSGVAQTRATQEQGSSLKYGMLFTHYHKTGTKFTNSLMIELAIWQDKDVCDYFVPQMDLQPAVDYPNGQSLRPHWDEPFDVDAHTISRVDSITSAWPFPDDVRMVHWYRRPVSLVMSAYRYHASYTSAEKWENVSAMCHMCDEDAHAAMFQVCGGNCSYFHLLNGVNETTGLALEVMNERLTMVNMIANLGRWANNPNVLHLSMAHLTTDFQATIKCLLRFYGLPAEDAMFMNSLKDLDVMSGQDGAKKHVTEGKYNNAALQAWLQNHPVWGHEFKKISELEEALFRRQQKQYGCPVPFVSGAVVASNIGTQVFAVIALVFFFAF